MKNHEDYITHINNPEDTVYLRTKHFPVNMRLFHSSPEYKAIILQQCEYIRSLCLDTKEGYKKPHGMSSANAGLAFNIIGITVNRNTPNEYCKIMINPDIEWYSDKNITTKLSGKSKSNFKFLLAYFYNKPSRSKTILMSSNDALMFPFGNLI